MRRQLQQHDGEADGSPFAIVAGAGTSVEEAGRWLKEQAESDRKGQLRYGLVAMAFGAVCLAGLVSLPNDWGDAPLGPGTVLGGCASLFLAMAALDLLWQLRVRRWSATHATILATGIRKNDRLWGPAVFFEYEVAGIAHRTHTVSAGGRPYFASPEEASRARATFRPGERRRCYFNPRNPQQAVLDQRLDFRDARIMAWLALGAMALWLIIVFAG